MRSTLGSVLCQEPCLQPGFESCRKIRCKFFLQNRGRCPFRSDCIYLHELPGGRPPRRGPQRSRIRAVSGETRPGGALGRPMRCVLGGPGAPRGCPTWLRLGLPLCPVLQELNPSPLGSSEEEEEDFCLLGWAVTRALLEVDSLYSSYTYEMLFGDSSDSD